MQFVVSARDHNVVPAERQRVREAHRARQFEPGPHAVKIVLADPTKSGSGEAMIGTLLVVQAQ